MRREGVARWDLELLKYRGFSPEWVIKKAYEKIKQSDVKIWEEIFEQAKNDGEPIYEFTPDDYRAVLVKNLLLIQDMWPHISINWEFVSKYVPGLSNIELNI